MARTAKEDANMTQATEFSTRYNDSYNDNDTNLMTALDEAGIESDQDWEAETTVWTFADGSQIRCSGPEVTVK